MREKAEDKEERKKLYREGKDVNKVRMGGEEKRTEVKKREGEW